MTRDEAARLLGIGVNDDVRKVTSAFEARDQDVVGRLQSANDVLHQAKYREVRERLTEAFAVLQRGEAQTQTPVSISKRSPPPLMTPQGVRAKDGPESATNRSPTVDDALVAQLHVAPQAEAADTPVPSAPRESSPAPSSTATPGPSTRAKLNRYGALVFGSLALLAVLVQTYSCVTKKPSTDDVAIAAATQLVTEKLKAPATASFGQKIAARGPNGWHLVHVVVDAQNSFGALVRASYLVSLKVTGDGSFEHDPNLAVHEVHNPPSADEIQLMRTLNGW